MLCMILFFNAALSFVVQYYKQNVYVPIHTTTQFAFKCTTNLPKAISSDWEWKNDHLNMSGPWTMFLPKSISDIPLIISNNEINPTMLFLDPSGRVSSTESGSTNSGFFLLDSMPSESLSDGRRFACVLASGFRYHNLRLVLLGRVFMSNKPIISELNNIIQLKSAIFIGHAFIEHYENKDRDEILHRLRHRISMVDIHYNEIDPINWKFVSMDGIGNPLRNLYGNDNWRWLGPTIGYRMLQDTKNDYFDKQTHMYHSNTAQNTYNYFDPEISEAPKIADVNKILGNIFNKAFATKCTINKPLNCDKIIEEVNCV